MARHVRARSHLGRAESTGANGSRCCKRGEAFCWGSRCRWFLVLWTTLLVALSVGQCDRFKPANKRPITNAATITAVKAAMYKGGWRWI